jgi:hypothetical protein
VGEIGYGVHCGVRRRGLSVVVNHLLEVVEELLGLAHVAVGAAQVQARRLLPHQTMRMEHKVSTVMCRH